MFKCDFDVFVKKVGEDLGLMNIINNHNYWIINNSTSVGMDQYILCCMSTDMRKYCKKNWSKDDYERYILDKYAPYKSDPDYYLHELFTIYAHPNKLNLFYRNTWMEFIEIPKKDRTNKKMWSYVSKFKNEFRDKINR